MKEISLADGGSRTAVQYLLVTLHSDRLHPTLLLKGHAVIQERIKHVTARALTGGAPDIIDVSIDRKLLRELKSTRRDSLFDYAKMLTGTAKICFGWCSP